MARTAQCGTRPDWSFSQECPFPASERTPPCHRVSTVFEDDDVPTPWRAPMDPSRTTPPATVLPAKRVFSTRQRACSRRDGLGASVPAVATAAGVGVGTIYRAFGSKDELIAALAVDRVDLFAAMPSGQRRATTPGTRSSRSSR